MVPGYITATCFDGSPTTERSWEMKIRVAARSAWISFSRLMMDAWTETSRADTGSSATITSGLPASARDGRALLLSAGEAIGLAVGQLHGQPHDVEEPRRLLPVVASGHAAQ